MRTIGTFNCGRWGKVSASRGTYDGANGPLAIVLTLANGEPLTTLSVNMYRPECSHDSKAVSYTHLTLPTSDLE